MGTIAYSLAMSHAPGMAAAPDAAPVAQRDRFFAAADFARQRLSEARPDLIVAIAPDHFANFFVDNMPAFCVGLNERYRGPVEKWLGMDPLSVPGAPDFARQVLWTAFEDELEAAFSESLELEHGLVVPLQFLRPEMDVPILWIMVNCLVPAPAQPGPLLPARPDRPQGGRAPWRACRRHRHGRVVARAGGAGSR